MLQAFIITLREGVEAALIVGITLAYLSKIGRNDLRKSVYAALAAAFAGSIGIAVVLSRLNWNQDIFEGWIMLVAAVFVVTMIVFMMKTGRKLKGEIEGKVGLFARGDAWIGLFLFVFLMVLREGVETVLILSAVILNSNELMSFIGTVLGVAVAILFGVMFVKGSVKINLQKFFKVTTAILFLVAAQLVISGLHELSENGVLPSSRQEMAIIGPIVRNDFFFFVTIFVLAALMVLFEMKSRQPLELPPPGPPPPQSPLDRPPRASLDGIGLRLLVRLHRDAHRQFHLREERQRALVRRGSHLRRRQSLHPADADLRRRTAPLRSQRRRRRSPFLALPEARRKDRYPLRRLRNLRPRRLLQGSTGRDLQKLRRSH